MSVNGRERFASALKIGGETRPPLVVTKTSGLAQQTGVRPQFVKTKPSKLFTIESKTPIFEGRSYVAETSIGKTSTVQTVAGGSKSVNPKNIGSLSKVQQFTAQKSLGLDKPVSSKVFQKIVPREAKTTIGEVTTTKQLKITPQGIERVPFGRRTSTKTTFTRSEPLIKGEGFSVAKETTTFKDSTKIFSRARGKTNDLITEVTTVDQPITFGKPSSGPSFGTRLSKPQSTVQRQVPEIPKPALPKITNPKTKTVVGEVSPKVKTVISRTAVSSVPITGVVRGSASVSTAGPVFKTTSVQPQRFTFTPTTDFFSAPKQETPVKTTPVSLSRSTGSQRPAFKQEPRIIQQPLQRPLQKPVQRIYSSNFTKACS